jgi:hypothetical protein
MTVTVLHRGLNIEQHEPHQHSNVNSDSPDGQAVPSSLVTHVVFNNIT